jgi:hypothetical protein
MNYAECINCGRRGHWDRTYQGLCDDCYSRGWRMDYWGKPFNMHGQIPKEEDILTKYYRFEHQTKGLPPHIKNMLKDLHGLHGIGK